MKKPAYFAAVCSIGWMALGVFGAYLGVMRQAQSLCGRTYGPSDVALGLGCIVFGAVGVCDVLIGNKA